MQQTFMSFAIIILERLFDYLGVIVNVMEPRAEGVSLSSFHLALRAAFSHAFLIEPEGSCPDTRRVLVDPGTTLPLASTDKLTLTTTLF